MSTFNKSGDIPSFKGQTAVAWLESHGYVPVGPERLISCYADDHALCDCVTHLSSGIPCKPVAVVGKGYQRSYRCMVCNTCWGQEWLDERHAALVRYLA
jgi:hypothetical protein